MAFGISFQTLAPTYEKILFEGSNRGFVVSGDHAFYKFHILRSGSILKLRFRDVAFNIFLEGGGALPCENEIYN